MHTFTFFISVIVFGKGTGVYTLLSRIFAVYNPIVYICRYADRRYSLMFPLKSTSSVIYRPYISLPFETACLLCILFKHCVSPCEPKYFVQRLLKRSERYTQRESERDRPRKRRKKQINDRAQATVKRLNENRKIPFWRDKNENTCSDDLKLLHL